MSDNHLQNLTILHMFRMFVRKQLELISAIKLVQKYSTFMNVKSQKLSKMRFSI